MEYIILILLIALLVLMIFLLLGRNGKSDKEQQTQLQQQSLLRQEMNNTITTQMSALSQNIQELRKELGNSITLQMTSLSQTMSTAQENFAKTQRENLKDVNDSFQHLRKEMSDQVEMLRKNVDDRLRDIQQNVDEKLQKTLEDKMTNSFKLVSERLEQVYKGLGEMQSIATSVGDLKKVLSNTKSRGIVGEIQLEAILQEILTPEQYDKDVATRPGSSDRVEFAIKLPGNEKGDYVYLPIDAKFPGDTYAALQDAYLEGDKTQIDAAFKQLENFIKLSAKSIRDKYVEPPHTTNFAILFLPFEGLYAEVVNRNLIEVLQRDYSVNIAGPSTMAAMLNALQMGFRTLQIQKRSDEVWKTLAAVKTEFETFGSVFKKAQERIRQLDDEMNKLVGTRTRAIERKLRNVQRLELDQAEQIIEIENDGL